MCPVQSVIQFLDEKNPNIRDQKALFSCIVDQDWRQQATMAGHSSVMIGWSWTDLSVLGSQLFGQASAESCEVLVVFLDILL